MPSKEEIKIYIDETLAMDILDFEIERIRRLLVGLERYPNPDKDIQKQTVETMTQIFRALLVAKK